MPAFGALAVVALALQAGLAAVAYRVTAAYGARSPVVVGVGVLGVGVLALALVDTVVELLAVQCIVGLVVLAAGRTGARARTR
jgi:hypothetical protein